MLLVGDSCTVVDRVAMYYIHMYTVMARQAMINQVHLRRNLEAAGLLKMKCMVLRGVCICLTIKHMLALVNSELL